MTNDTLKILMLLLLSTLVLSSPGPRVIQPSERELDNLLKDLGSDDPEKWSRAIEKFVDIGKKAVKFLKEALEKAKDQKELHYRISNVLTCIKRLDDQFTWWDQIPYKATEEWYKEHNDKWHEFTDKCPKECELCQKKISKNITTLLGHNTKLSDRDKEMKVICKYVVRKSLVGLALLSGGSSLTEGQYTKELNTCYKDILETSFERYEHHSNWALGFSTLFLCEVYKKNPSAELKKKLEEMSGIIEKNQEPSGGWHHNAYYLARPIYAFDLLACTNVVGIALGQLKRCEINVKEDMIEKLAKCYEKCANKDGGMLYRSGVTKLIKEHPTHKNSEAGRTGGALAALLSLQKQDRDLYKNALRFFEKNTKQLLESHGGLNLHRLMCGIACYKIGGDLWKRYREEILSRSEYPKVNFNNWDGGSCLAEAADVILLNAPLEHLTLLSRPN